MTYIDTISDQFKRDPSYEIIETLKSSDYYGTDERCRVIKIKNKGQEQILKIYDDPRPNYEFENTQVLPHLLQSPLISMPKVIEGQSNNTESKRRGWYIMENVTLQPFQGDINNFLQLFKEYSTTFSQEIVPHIPTPTISSADFHLQRIKHWLNLTKYFGDQSQTPPESIINELHQLFEKTSPIIENAFQSEPFRIGHNHFSFAELHSTPDRETPYTLTDFGHLGWKPASYELSFIIWHEFMLKPLKNGQPEQITESTFEGINNCFNNNLYTQSPNILYAGLLERSLGTLFADIWSSNPSEHQEIKLAKHQSTISLITELTNNLPNS